jgi:hypothetical protein
MPFIVYRTNKVPNGATHYHEPRHVSLAGSGLIRSTLRRLGLLGENDVSWTINAADLLGTGGYEPDAHALVSFCRKTPFCYTGPRLFGGNGSGFGGPDGFWIPSLSFISLAIAD